MIQKLQKLHAKKGFTLTELIIVIAILAVMMAAVAAFSQPVQRMVKATAVTADAITANEIIGEYIQGRLAYSDFLFIHYAVDSPTIGSTPNIIDTMTAVKTRLADAKTGGKAGVLIFRYAANANEPEKSGYMLYDFPILGTTGYANFLDGTGDLKDAYKVYNDDFYGSTQRIIYLPHRTPKVNSVRGEVFLSFEILSYMGDPGYMVYSDYVGGTVDNAQSVFISPWTLPFIYQQADATPPVTAVLDRLVQIKKGDANTSSFVLQNFTSDTLMNLSRFRMYPESGDPIASTGSDVLIFYHIPEFTKNSA